jgi:hypothetical protein
MPQPGLLSRRAAANQIIESRRATAPDSAAGNDHTPLADWLADHGGNGPAPSGNAPRSAEAKSFRK